MFTRYRGEDRAEKAALFTVRLDGTNLRQLTTFKIHAGDADWSPGGRRLVFEAYPNPGSFGDVYVIGANGRNLRNLTRNPAGRAGSADPVWSPDGKTILFLDNRVDHGKPKSGLATMSPTGSRRAPSSCADRWNRTNPTGSRLTETSAPRSADPAAGQVPCALTAASAARVASYTACWDCGDVYMEVA